MAAGSSARILSGVSEGAGERCGQRRWRVEPGRRVEARGPIEDLLRAELLQSLPSSRAGLFRLEPRGGSEPARVRPRSTSCRAARFRAAAGKPAGHRRYRRTPPPAPAGGATLGRDERSRFAAVAPLDIKLDRGAVLDQRRAPLARARRRSQVRDRNSARCPRPAEQLRRLEERQPDHVRIGAGDPADTVRRRGPGSHSRRPCRAIRRSRDRRRSPASLSRLNADLALDTARRHIGRPGSNTATPP